MSGQCPGSSEGILDFYRGGEMSSQWFHVACWRIGKFRSRFALRGICGLLWMIRRLGFTLECDQGRVLYRWVRDFEGSFDHWFTIGGRPYAVASVRRSLGSWRLTWKILIDSQLLVGRGRRYHKAVVMACSEAYYCLEPIFELRRGSGINSGQWTASLQINSRSIQ